MAILYLDQTELRLLNHGFGFTGSRKPRPKEGLIEPIEIDENVYSLKDQGHHVVCRRLDGKDGNYHSYTESLKRDLGL